MSVTYDAILTRPATFAWETSEYIKVTREGSAKFKNEDWNTVNKASPAVRRSDDQRLLRKTG